MSVPSIMIEPLSGLSRPMRVLRNTDLPVPDGPSITQTSPAGIVSVTSPQMRSLPNALVRFSTLISTPTVPLSSASCADSPVGIHQRPVAPPLPTRNLTPSYARHDRHALPGSRRYNIRHYGNPCHRANTNE